MSDMKALQDALNSNPALKQQFLTNPAKVLTDHGLKVDASQLEALEQQMKTKFGTGANPNAVSVGITVGN